MKETSRRLSSDHDETMNRMALKLEVDAAKAARLLPQADHAAGATQNWGAHGSTSSWPTHLGQSNGPLPMLLQPFPEPLRLIAA